MTTRDQVLEAAKRKWPIDSRFQTVHEDGEHKILVHRGGDTLWLWPHSILVAPTLDALLAMIDGTVG